MTLRVRTTIRFAAAFCTLASLAARASIAQAADVEVRVLDVANSRGSVRVAVCSETQWIKPSCALGARVPAHAGTVIAVVKNVPPGIYGVLVHHDANDDGGINRTLLGIPKEGIGFSRDAPLRFGPPRFVDAALKVGEQRVIASASLIFEPREAKR